MIGADPVGSIYSQGEDAVKPYLVEGVGEDFWPATFDPQIVDRYVAVSDKESFLAARRLAMTEGILAGGSCGTALHAALQVAAEITDPEAMVCVILPDGGRSYLSKIFNDAWMTQHGFLERGGRRDGRRGAAPQAGGRRDPAARQRPRARPGEGRDRAAARAPRLAAARSSASTTPHAVVGSIGERGLLRRAIDDPALLGAADRRRHGGAVPGGLRRRRGARSRRAAQRRAPGAARDRATAARSGSSRARTCSKRSRAERALRRRTSRRRALRHPRGARGPRARPALPLGHPGDPPDLDVRAAGARRVPRGVRLRAHGEPDAPRARGRAGRARGRARDGVRLRPGRRARADHGGLRRRAITSCCRSDLYGGTFRLVDKILTRWGLRYTMVDQTDLDALAAALAPGDADRLDRDADEPAPRRRRRRAPWSSAVADALVVVDNTFATPGQPAPARARRRRGDPLGDEVPRRALGHGARRGRRARPGAARAGALRPERRRRDPGPDGLLPRAPRAAHAAPADGGERRERARRERVPRGRARRVSEVRWPGFSGMVSFRHPDAHEHRAPARGSSRSPSRSAASSR